MSSPLASALYAGTVRHRRFTPVTHEFRYRLSLFYLNLDDLPSVFSSSRWFSHNRRNLGWFRRADYMGDPGTDLKACVLQTVQNALGDCPPDAQVCLLCNIRLWGSCFNPVSVYYIYDRKAQLYAVAAQVNNTPWNQRHTYVMRADERGRGIHTRFAKAFHVSPFNPMDMDYQWASNRPGDRLNLHMENWRDEQCHMDATMTLSRRPITAGALNRLLFATPFNSLKVPLAIYWQAAKLWLKGTPLYTHPDARAPRK